MKILAIQNHIRKLRKPNPATLAHIIEVILLQPKFMDSIKQFKRSQIEIYEAIPKLVKEVLQNSPPLIFNSINVSRVTEHKHLGLWLSSSLTWSRQISETCLKANGKLAVLRHAKFLNRSTLDLLYKITVRSVIDYGLFF